jgi:hypothetical protein
VKKQDVITGILVILILVGGVYFINRARKSNKIEEPIPTPSISERVSDTFGGLTIPPDVDRADLKGDEGVGIATRSYENGRFELTVLADLENPPEGYFYQAWLVRDDPSAEGSVLISASKLRVAKGGYLAEFIASEDYSDYKKVTVTLEKTFDQTPEKEILTGSF